MTKANFGTTTIRSSVETQEFFKGLYEASGCNSQGEFLQKLCEKWNSPDETIEPVIRTVTVEKELLQSEIIMNLTAAQEYALRQTVLSSPDFAEQQNKIIDSLTAGERPFLYFGNLFLPEFKSIWVKSIPLTKTMFPADREKAVKHNMSAFLINMFLTHIIEGRISATHVNADSLSEFIRSQAKPKEVNPQKVEPCKI